LPVKRRLRDTFWKSFKDGEQWKPDAYWKARVLGGLIKHYAGAASQVDIRKTDASAGEYTQIYLCVIESASTGDTYVLNPKTATSIYTEEYTTDSTKIWFGRDTTLRFDGCTGWAKCGLLIEVVKIDEETGEFLA